MARLHRVTEVAAGLLEQGLVSRDGLAAVVHGVFRLGVLSGVLKRNIE